MTYKNKQTGEKGDLSNDNQIEILLLKSTVLMKLGEFERSNKILGDVLGKETINPLKAVDALIINAENLMRQGEFD